VLVGELLCPLPHIPDEVHHAESTFALRIRIH
jgi:hypothetical protein